MTRRQEPPRACANTSAVILAGGKSRRIGRPKAFLDLGGRPLIQSVIEVVRDTFPETLIVGPDTEPLRGLGLRLIPDRYPGAGPVGGAYTGITEASHPHVLVVGCDMPFLSSTLLAHLAGRIDTHAAIVPRAADGLHPLHAVYSRDALSAFSSALEAGEFSFMALLSRLDAVKVEEEEMRRYDPELLSLFNVNQPGDFEAARKHWELRRTASGARASGEQGT